MRTLLTLALLLTLSSAFSQALTTVEQRTKFLNNVYLTHKAVNHYEDSVLAVTGFHSPEHLLAIDSLREMDTVLSKKISHYLNTFGYPPKDVYGETANLTPWYILQQSTRHDIKTSQFSCLYKAYKKDELELRRLIAYLENEYEYQFQKNYQSPLQDELRLKDLMSSLDLKMVKL